MPTIYKLDIKKLHKDLDTRRRQNRLSWDRLSNKIGIGSSTLHGFHAYNNTTFNVAYSVIKYLRKPMEDYIIETEVDNSADSEE